MCVISTSGSYCKKKKKKKTKGERAYFSVRRERVDKVPNRITIIKIYTHIPCEWHAYPICRDISRQIPGYFAAAVNTHCFKRIRNNFDCTREENRQCFVKYRQKSILPCAHRPARRQATRRDTPQPLVFSDETTIEKLKLPGQSDIVENTPYASGVIFCRGELLSGCAMN